MTHGADCATIHALFDIVNNEADALTGDALWALQRNADPAQTEQDLPANSGWQRGVDRRRVHGSVKTGAG